MISSRPDIQYLIVISRIRNNVRAAPCWLAGRLAGMCAHVGNPNRDKSSEARVRRFTVPLGVSKVFISRSCPILVLTTVLCRPRHDDAENSVLKTVSGANYFPRKLDLKNT